MLPGENSLTKKHEKICNQNQASLTLKKQLNLRRTDMGSFFNSWLPFIYLYVVGGIFFISGLVIIKKSGALDFKIAKHRRWFYILISGFLYFMMLHAILIISALYL